LSFISMLQAKSHHIFFAAILACLVFSACTDDTSNSSSIDPLQSEIGKVVFKEVSDQAGISNFRHEIGAVGNKWYPEQMGSGSGFVDIDGDQWLDIILLGGGNWESDKPSRAISVYRNLADGTFEDVTEGSGLENLDAYTIGLAAGDPDNDGDQDLFISTLTRNYLFRNDEGLFTDISGASGLNGRSEWSSSAMFVDVNKDGLLDLYAGNYVDWTPETDKWCPEGSPVKYYCIPADYEGISSRFYLNKGNLVFEDVTEEAGFTPNLGKSLGVAELDYNQDGFSDLVVVNDGEGDLLYENKGDGTFEERGVVAGIAFSEHGEARAGMGVDVAVVDSSNAPTIFVGNFSEENVGVYAYRGRGLFRDRATTSKVGLPSYLTLTFGLFLADFDSDSDLDLFTANGHVYPGRLEGQDKITYRQAPQIYLNDGTGRFDELKDDQAIFQNKIVARGASYGDYDRDGDIDILMTENDGPAHLWRNDTVSANSLRLRLEGVDSNTDAIGTEVEVKTGELSQYRRVRSGSSYLSASEYTLTFGLGENEFADIVTIRWPSGKVDEFTHVISGQEIIVKEGSGVYQADLLPVGLKNKAERVD